MGYFWAMRLAERRGFLPLPAAAGDPLVLSGHSARQPVVEGFLYYFALYQKM
jgi:hypothetical protein